LIGTNDFGNPDLNRSREEVGRRVIGIINQIQIDNPKAKIIVNSILPRSAVFADRIKVANQIISSGLNDSVTYLDCWPALSEGDQLRDEYLLVDGFDAHLSDAGYAAWRTILVPALRNEIPK